MELQLEQLRKAAGYKSRKAFADAFGTNERQIKAWECGERKLRLSDAYDLAEFLHCTLDELAGREWSPPAYSDNRQQALNHSYSMLNDKSKGELAGFANSLTADPSRLAEKSGEGAEPVVTGVEELSA